MGTSNRFDSPRPPQYYLQYFPQLSAGNHSVQSPVTEDYNCIAWAAGSDDSQVWPDNEDSEWPTGLPQEETVESFVAYYESLGYQLCDGSDLEEGFLKVAIYLLDGEPTHASRQLPTGKWTSKIGREGPDIEHDDLSCIQGSSYGQVLVFLRRATPEADGTTTERSSGD